MNSSKEFGPEVSAEKTNCVSSPACRMKSGYKDCEQSLRKYETVRDQNFIHEEIKNRLNSWDAGYHSLQNTASMRLLPKILISAYKKLCCLLFCVGVQPDFW
jgi:hypothetical protein